MCAATYMHTCVYRVCAVCVRAGRRAEQSGGNDDDDDDVI